MSVAGRISQCLFLLGLSLGVAHAATVIDEGFDSPDALKDWRWLSDVEGWADQVAKVSVAGGELLIEPYTSYWLAGFHAPFLMQEFEGDFVMTARVKAEGLKPGSVPRSYSDTYIGIMARQAAPKAADWKPSDENYVWLAMGADGTESPSISVMRTVSGNSQQLVYATRQAWHELRLVRIGSTFVALHRVEGKPWRVTQRDTQSLRFTWQKMSERDMTHPGLPSRLQVGITATTDFLPTMQQRFAGLSDEPAAREFNLLTVRDGKRDLRAHIDYFRLARFQAPERWVGKDTNSLSEAELLSELGESLR
ncbi:hypothetical protein [Niveibacterium sp. COAC-50]|uniref:hypothetical protein n=1 Tax=Niveibacterium sp. COAC-50 TaxID=2729384 RepID=UPI001552E3BB|nr:hypothetical protein [Niveibacterium sp. COAC-50]